MFLIILACVAPPHMNGTDSVVRFCSFSNSTTTAPVLCDSRVIRHISELQLTVLASTAGARHPRHNVVLKLRRQIID